MSSREIEKGLVKIWINFDFFIRANSGRRKCNNNYTLQRRGRFIGEGPPAETTRHIRIKREFFFFLRNFCGKCEAYRGKKNDEKNVLVHSKLKWFFFTIFCVLCSADFKGKKMFVFITWKMNIERANDVHNVNIFIREKLCLDFYYVFCVEPCAWFLFARVWFGSVK